METAAKVLITGGVGFLLYAFLVGFALARARKGGAEASRYLVLTHTGGVMTGSALLALTLALPLSAISAGMETLAAWLLLAGGALIALGDTTLWLGGTKDAFVDRPIGFQLQGIGAVSLTAGLIILAVGVVKGL